MNLDEEFVQLVPFHKCCDFICLCDVHEGKKCLSMGRFQNSAWIFHLLKFKIMIQIFILMVSIVTVVIVCSAFHFYGL